MNQDKQLKKDALKTFWKTVGAAFGAHVGGVIIACLFCFGLASLLADGYYFIMIPLILFLYSYPLYGTMWNAGLRDRNYGNRGHGKLRNTHGLVYVSVAIIPVIVMAVLMVLSKFHLFDNFVVLFKILNAEIWPIVNAINPQMYLDRFDIYQILVISLLSVAVPLIIGEFGYYMGRCDISLKQKLIYKDDKKQPTVKK